MNKFKINGQENLYEIIVPFGGEAGGPGDSLFDDCPLCQELKRQMDNGEVESVPVQVEVDDGK